MKQTFIIKHWYGAANYLAAQGMNYLKCYDDAEHGADFNRVGVKKVETALKYLKGWRRQAKEKGLEKLFATLCRDDARYEIIATPDGYHETEVVASGWMKDLD